MKRKFTFYGIAVAGLALATMLTFRVFSSAQESRNEELSMEEKEEAEEMFAADAYREWLNSMRANPKTGKVEMADILAAREEMHAYFAARQSGERGGSLLNLEWENFGPNNVGGRTRAMLVDRNNTDRIYVTGASGGIYYSNNGGLDWQAHPQNDEFSSLIICTIDQAANGDIYFGTGEYWADYFDGSFGSYTHGFAGDGIFKAPAVTGDEVPTFTQLTSTIPTPSEIGSTASASFAYINRISCHPTDANIIAASTNTGLKISTDGGTTWENCEGGGAPLTSNSDDCKFDSDGYLHAIAGSLRKYYRTANTADPGTLDELGVGVPTGSTRRALAVSPSDGNYVYIYSAKSGTYGLQGIYQSTDRGANFVQITEEANDFFNPNGTGANQTWNVCIGVNPANPQRIYIGGQIQSWTWDGASGSWTPMTSSGYPAFYPKYIHADHHYIYFPPDYNADTKDVMYFCSDGGVSRSLNATSQYPDFGTLNKGLNLYQAHGVASGLLGEVMGGSQDNGTQLVDFKQNSEFQSFEWLGGDGGKVEISKIRPEYLFGTFFYVGASGNGAALRRSVNGGGSASNMYDPNIDDDQDGLADGGTDFVTTFVMWENYKLYETFKDVLTGGTVEYPAGSGDFYAENDVVNYEGRDITLNKTGLSESRFYHAVKNKLWMTPGALFNSTEAPEWFRVLPTTSGNISAIEYDATGDIVYVGTENGRLYRLSGMLTANYEYVDVDGDPGTAGVFDPVTAGITQVTYANVFPGKITGLSIDRNNPDQIAISIGGYGVDQNVWVSEDALSNDAATFTCVSDGGALPNIPVYDILVHVADPDKLIIGTEFGVWSYSISSGAAWTQESAGKDGSVGPGNVPVFEVREDFVREMDCMAIYLGTHGNGYYRTTTLATGDCDFTTVSAGPIQEEIIAGITIAPNPAHDYTNATFTLEKSVASMNISLVNLAGTVVRNYGTASYPEGTRTVNLDIKSITPGVYLVVFTYDGRTDSRKLVVF